MLRGKRDAGAPKVSGSNLRGRPKVSGSVLLDRWTPKQLEGVVGAMMKRPGVRVEVSGRPGDGGIDVRVSDEKTGKPLQAVQVKHTPSVGSPIIDNLTGAALDWGAPESVIATSGLLTKPAQQKVEGWANPAMKLSAYQRQKIVSWIDGRSFAEYSKLIASFPPLGKDQPPQRSSAPRKAYNSATPACPDCRRPMVRRVGPHGQFWGCSRYPLCRGTIPIA